MKTAAVSSAEAKRGFSVLNIICTDKRASLSGKHISNVMTVNIIGQPVDSWIYQLYMKTWKRHYADDLRVRPRSEKNL
jgi:hypothetical protein